MTFYKGNEADDTAIVRCAITVVKDSGVIVDNIFKHSTSNGISNAVVVQGSTGLE